MKDMRKVLAIIVSVVMLLGSCSLNACTLMEKDNIPDFRLDGDENGIYPMIGTYMPPAKNDQLTDDYRYLGFASFIDDEAGSDIEVSKYRYLVLTYTGDITQLRFEFEGIATAEDVTEDSGSEEDVTENVGIEEDVSDEVVRDDKTGPFWFNPESEDGNCFVTADGSDIPLVGDNTIIVIDLKESGVDMSRYNLGVHMHCDSMVAYGNGEGIIISDAYLTTKTPK